MSARFALATLLPLLAGCATPGETSSPSPNSQYTAKALAAACKGRDGWSDPAPPARVYGNTWYVGTCGISAILITSDKGHVLIDTGLEEAVPLVAANIEKLGFAVTDVKLILISHEHYDHTGGLAEMKRRTGAQVYAFPAAAKVIEEGVPGADDPQARSLPGTEPTHGIAVLTDRQLLTPFPSPDGAFPNPIQLEAFATPAHSPGSGSWTWQSCEGTDCRTLTYADSATAIAGHGYRFAAHPDRIAAVRQGLAVIADLPCGVLLTPHPGASDMFARLAAGAKVDPGACRAYAARASVNFDKVLSKESAGG